VWYHQIFFLQKFQRQTIQAIGVTGNWELEKSVFDGIFEQFTVHMTP
jgi:hypothetical protein